jgi:hypothetical protein
MKELKCEEVLTAKMAELDGEIMASDDAELHLANCDACRREVAAMQDMNVLFRSHDRALHDVRIWPRIEDRISTQPATFGWKPFAAIAAALVAFKLIEMSVRDDPGFLFGLVPLVFAAMLFIVLRENPFKVNADLAMEK